MTLKSDNMKLASLGDRFSELAVILLTLVALGAGWLLKTEVENRSLPFTSGNITAQVPSGWLKLNPQGDEVLHITDRSSSGFGTTYLIQTQTIPVDTQSEQVAGLLTLDRGHNLTAYRILDQKEVLVQGREATEIDYVYVESDANLTHAAIPTVVRGLDYVFVTGDRAVIVSYHADQSVYNLDLGRFLRFLVSVKF